MDCSTPSAFQGELSYDQSPGVLKNRTARLFHLIRNCSVWLTSVARSRRIGCFSLNFVAIYIIRLCIMQHVLIDSSDDKKFGFAMNYSFSSELVRWILIWHSNVIAFELNFQLDHRQVLKISFRHPMSVGSESKTFFNTKSPLNHFSRDG